MNKVKETSLPTTSVYKNYIDRVDYFDAFEIKLVTNLNAEMLYKGIFATLPLWVKKLMALRNKIVSLFGLKVVTDNRERLFEVGKRVGMFQLYYLSEQEVIAGEDDRHLNFRVSVLKEQERVIVTTLVQYNNGFGKFYMSLIKPFHKLIVQLMMRRYLKGIK